jgi:hypothetical protein
MSESRGSIGFFTTYRPSIPLDIFSCPVPPLPLTANSEELLTDGVSYNQNCRPVPPAALKELLVFLGKNNPELAARCGASLREGRRPRDAVRG